MSASATQGGHNYTSGLVKRTAAILKFYYRFDFDLPVVIGISFCIGTPNFTWIGPWAIWLEMPIILRPFSVGFCGTFPQLMSLIVQPPKTVLLLNHVIWAIKREYWPHSSSWALREEEKTVQNRIEQEKVTKWLYFTYLERSPIEAIYFKNCVLGDVLDVITCTKFQNEIFRGYDFTGGRIFHFLLIFESVLQRRCAAYDNGNHGHLQ